MDNANSPEYLAKIRDQVIENLSRTQFAPSAQMQDVPRDIEGMDDEAEAELDDLDEDENKDVRNTTRQWDKRVERDDELDESEDEDENQRNGILPSDRPKRRDIRDFQNPNAVPDGFGDSGMGSPSSDAARDTAPSANGRHTEDGQGGQSGNGSANCDVEMEMDHNNEQPPTNPDSIQQEALATIQRSTGQRSAEIDAGDAMMQEALDAPAAIKAQGASERHEEDTNAEAATEFVSNS